MWIVSQMDTLGKRYDQRFNVSDLRVGSALVHMYANCGSLDDARVVFEGIDRLN